MTGWKEWGIGEVVEAGDFQTYVQDQTVQNYATSAARGSALGTAVAEGMVSYLQDSNTVEVYDGSAWVQVGNDLSSGTAGYTALSNGTAGLSYQPVSHNYIINGAFDVWQRGTSFSAGAPAYSADRWLAGRQAGTSGSTLSQSTDAPANFTYSAKMQRDSGNTATNDLSFTHRFEDAGKSLAGKQITLSFYAKAGADFSDSSLRINHFSTSAEWSSVAFNSDGTMGGANPDLDSSNNEKILTTSWQRFTQILTVASTANSLMISFRFDPTGTAGADDSFYLTGVQLEAGSIATPFKRNAPSLQGELAACQRYYQVYGTQANEFLTTGFCYSTSQTLSAFNFAQELRTTPTISFSSAGDFNLYAVGASGKTVTTIVAGFISSKSFRLQANIGTTDLVAGNATNVFSGSVGGKIEVSAEL